MELQKTGDLDISHLTDSCRAIGVEESVSDNCDESADLGRLFQEINEMYTERLQKLDEPGDTSELRTKLLYMWVTDLLEQNASLVETVGELERVAADRVLLLEDKLRRSSSSIHRYMTKVQAEDGHTTMSLRALVSRLEVDIGSLLELIRRARKGAFWDIRGLVFHEVSYWDIFGCAPPPPSAPRKDESGELPKNNVEVQNLKAEVEFWRARAEKTEAEGKVVSLEDTWTLEQGKAQRLAAERAQQVLVLERKLDEAEQRGKDAQAALAEEQDRVTQLRQRLEQQEEDLRLARMHSHLRDEVIKGMRKEVKRFRSQLTLLDPSSLEASTGSCAHCGRSATPEAAGDLWIPPVKDVRIVDNVGMDGEPPSGDVRGGASEAPVDM